MNEREIFAQLLRYFPEGEDKKMCSNMCAYSEACLAAGDFTEAENYADKLLAQDCDEVCLISARRTKLFCKLQCRSNEEFRHCAQFTKEMPEYSDLIVACAENEKKLSGFIKLAENNLQTVENDRLKREEEERKRIEEAELIRRIAEEKAEQERLKRERAEERKRKKTEREEQERIAAERQANEKKKQDFFAHLPLIIIGICILVMVISFFVGAYTENEEVYDVCIKISGGSFVALIFAIIFIFSDN